MFNHKPRFPKFRPLPDEIAPPQPGYLCSGDAAIAACADYCRRADAIVQWLYGPRGQTPHGFYQPLGFVEASIRNSKRNAIYRALVRRMVARDIARGRLGVVDHKGHKAVFVRVKEDV
jgi:hypothetical protein